MSPNEDKLEEIRKRIDEIDDVIADLLSQRMQYAKETKAEKVRLKKPIIDRQRQREVIEKWRERARRNRGSSGYDLSEEMMSKIAELIIEYTVIKEMEEQ
ncbi:MAG: chorismate mutase [archaeon]|nr:chorismate mutase [archaeon]MDI6886259.1 chorismate mutase [archaeon]